MSRKAIIMFIDFPDAIGKDDTAAVAERVKGNAEEWYKNESFGKLELVVDCLKGKYPHQIPE